MTELPGDAAQPIIGPYLVRGVLGRGGMGVVYRGEHARTGEPVAIKTVNASSEPMLASIRREIYALRRLDHPGLVHILDEGVWQGLPWYAMELLQGSTLGTLLRATVGGESTEMDPRRAALRGEAQLADTEPMARLPAPPRPFAQAVAAGPRSLGGRLSPLTRIIERLCAPLAYLHGNGLVHRDLKPENIFIRPDGSPVLVDFGIAALFSARGREELELEGFVAGSIEYMAPEQIRGDLVDPRADLYALGGVLYECVTGRPPFVGAAPEVLRQHLQERPRPPSFLAPGIPRELEHLILKLLEKRPKDRIGYAEDVARTLRALDHRDEEPASAPRTHAYLYRPELTGREAVLRQIQAALIALARERRGARIFIGGESGVGKTRLALEITRVATQQRLQVITGQGAALGLAEGRGAAATAAPLHLFRPLLQAIADRCREQGRAETERILGPRGKTLSLYEPSLADLPGQREQPDPPRLDPQAARARVLGALREAIRELARAAPLVLVLDDLQWADELSLSAISELGAGGAGAEGVLLIGTYRMEEMGEALGAIVGDAGAARVALGRLDRAGVGAMAAGMLALPWPPEELVDFLRERSDGNPFFIAEYLRAAIDARLLTRSPEGEWWLTPQGSDAGSLAASVPLPRTLAALIERRLADLGEQRRGLVEVAAVLGRDFDGGLLAAAAGADDAAMLEGLEILRVRQIIEDRGEGRLSFVHDKIREIAYREIPAERRRELHRRAALSLEALGSSSPDRLPALAHHFAMAGVHDQASRYYGRAGDAARAAYANREAITFYRTAIDEAREALRGGAPAGGWLEAIGDLEERLGDMLSLTGMQEEARAAYEGALAGAPEGARTRRARLLRKMGRSFEPQHQHEEVLRCYMASAHVLGASPLADGPEAWWHEWIELHIDRIRLHYWLAQVDEMMALAEEVRPAVEELGTVQQRVQLFQTLARLGFRRERYMLSAETVRHAETALAAVEGSGDLAEIAEARFFYAFTLLFHGSLTEAESYMLRAIDGTERVGDASQRARCLTYLTVIYRRLGLDGETVAAAERALAAATEAHMPDYVGAAKANLAWAAFRGGRFAEAEHGARAALDLWRPLPLVYPIQWMARLPLAAMCRERGDLGEAVEHARAMLDLDQQRLPDALAAGLEGIVAAASAGDWARARSELDRALALARDLGFA